uniref:Diaminopimelate epimerase n=1 Tax=Candidatus Kentrum eta TaxID=2126337 RepID=A0A450VJ56_9GAMM|nr:MAG: diaminopimelate epimerase [Candidatus Kentron sp. H]VFK04839.1 MAG: diaminopimelate epimerase [Candidatus Kentron sp. H]VFK07901.1 MAG: diaminopimelate epimerase [Candidatus Kentron sp. H]
MSLIPFIKMHGLGNDYIYFDCIANPNLIDNPSSVAAKLSNRHFSIGGDGIVLIRNHPDADFQMRMFNADGSEAEMCGNAIRCVGKFLYDKGYSASDTIRIMTGAGILTLGLKIDNGKVNSVRVDMGEPILNGPEIPVAVEANPVRIPISLAGGRNHDVTCVSMGNPHAVIFVDEITDEHVFADGKEMERDSLFPNRINVEFAKIISRNTIEMRVWERGSGETLACGTGACATTVAAVINDLTDRKVKIKLRGGDLLIEWSKNDNHIYMTGPAAIAFTGEVEIE